MARCAVDDCRRRLFLRRAAYVWRGRRVCGLQFYDRSCRETSHGVIPRSGPGDEESRSKTQPRLDHALRSLASLGMTTLSQLRGMPKRTLNHHRFLRRGKKVRRNSRTTDSAGSASGSGTTSTSSSCTSAETSAKSDFPDFPACAGSPLPASSEPCRGLSGTADGPRLVGDGASDCATSGVTPWGGRRATCGRPPVAATRAGDSPAGAVAMRRVAQNGQNKNVGAISLRSEERRVGKECRSRWSPY